MSAAKREPAEPFHHRWLLAALSVAAFLSPGAWLVVQLPDRPIAQALHLATVALLLVMFALGFLRLQKPPTQLVWAVGAVGVVSVLSLALNRFPWQQLVYDLYADMPMVLWLAYPIVFLVAASVVWDSAIPNAVRAVVFTGTLLVAVMVLWRWNVGFVTTFGSPAFSVPALVPLPFLALGLASYYPKNRVAFRLAAAGIAAGLAYAGAGLSAFFALGIAAVVTLAFAPVLLGIPERFVRIAQALGLLLLALLCMGTLLAQIPAVGAAAAGVEDPSSLDQTLATRLYLWDAAMRMTAERPVLGWGPAGYRFSAVGFYDPGVFGFIADLGADPIAFSAPSPHSLAWEALTRMGVLGVMALAGLFAVWTRTVGALRDAELGNRLLRRSLAVGFVAYLSALLVTPVHFASGLLGAVIGGFAVAAAPGVREPLNVSKPVAAAVAALAVVLLALGTWRMVGLTVGTVSGQDAVETDRGRVESAGRIIPGEPMNERRRLEMAFWAARTPGELTDARAAVDAAPGYVTDFLPNLPHFAFLGLNRAQQLELDDFSWERELLERADEGLPETPPLVAEQLHLAIAEGDLEALPELMERAEQYGLTYPRTADYILRAREALIP
jgi:O-antigen ligase